MPFYLESLTNLEKEIVSYLETLSIYDCHEHLPPESSRLSRKPDAFTLFSHYCQHDLYTGGMDKETMGKVLWQPGDLDWKWRTFEPFYRQMKHTSYCRAAHITMEKFYGEGELTAANVHAVSERITAANQPGLYDCVLRDACKIIASINCDGPLEDTHGGRILQTVRALDELRTYEDVLKRFGDGQTPVGSIDEVLDACENFTANAKEKGAVGMKFMAFYIDGAMKEDAAATLAQMKADPSLTLPRRNPLNEFVLTTLLSMAHDSGLVNCVHTGYWNDYRELSPANLLPFIIKNQDVKIDLYHAGYPYVREAIMLGKVWPNVRMNMCWTYLISPRFAFDALDEMLEMLPDNKIFGFGGDYYVVEKVFGHLVMARETIARVLAKKVAEKTMSLDRALEIGRKMLYDNPREFYGFKE
ncbi:MAG: amidohydrolase family protein [Oscillospiraceae bacterium]|jgi:predicted TIM-barrel fold metal-dependent hydrolase|nr:amidohydrolase family protein [Oscillospiraceae bacterium]